MQKRKLTILFLILASSLLSFFFLFQIAQIRNQVETISNYDPICFFNGDFIQGDLPIEQITKKSDIYNPVEDFMNTYLNSERAKPYHFGFVINRSGTPEIWAWSYKTSSFWLSNDPHKPYVTIHAKCFPEENWFASTR